MFFRKIKSSFYQSRNQLAENSCDTLLWLVNIMPNTAGFSFFKNKISVFFWLIFFFLAIYVYVFGTITYSTYYAKETFDFVNTFFNLSIFSLIINGSIFMLWKRFSIQEVLKLVKENDNLVSETERFVEKHNAYLKTIKILLLSCLTFHFINDVLIFTTGRVVDSNDINFASCTGLDPLSGTPNMVMCRTALAFQEFTAIVVVGTYDILLIFLTTHTTAMCNIIKHEVDDLKEIVDVSTTERNSLISLRLKNIVQRHTKILLTVKKIQSLYSAAIGIDFGNYAISILLVFVLPLDICLKFGPLVSHNFLIFFIYCLLGQMLTTAAERVEMAIYCCGWETFRQKDRKAVLFMLKQSQKPVVLVAANVVPIRIYTFASTMQTIYKFVTVFKV